VGDAFAHVLLGEDDVVGADALEDGRLLAVDRLRPDVADLQLGSRSLPMATTTRLKSVMPISVSASGSVESATTTWPSWPDSFWTTSGRWSMASTSEPPRASSSARAVPNRPRPMTATGSLWLANDGPLLGELVAAGAFAQCQPGGQGERPDPADVHEQHEQHLSG
jgi:hypothetical protein